MFMYLVLDIKDGKLVASIKNDGKFAPRSLGTESSQLTHSPVAVFRIEGFDGIDCISDDELIFELHKRFTVTKLLDRMNVYLTDDELMAIMTERLRRRNP